MTNISAAGISTATLENIYEIRACLVSGAKPVIAHRFTLSNDIVFQSAELIRDDRDPFDDINEARAALDVQRSILSALGFEKGPSPDAKRFLDALLKLKQPGNDAFNPNQIGAAAQAALLNSTSLEDVLVELDGKKIHRGTNNYLTFIRTPELG